MTPTAPPLADWYHDRAVLDELARTGLPVTDAAVWAEFFDDPAPVARLHGHLDAEEAAAWHQWFPAWHPVTLAGFTRAGWSPQETDHVVTALLDAAPEVITFVYASDDYPSPADLPADSGDALLLTLAALLPAGTATLALRAGLSLPEIVAQCRTGTFDLNRVGTLAALRG